MRGIRPHSNHTVFSQSHYMYLMKELRMHPADPQLKLQIAKVLSDIFKRDNFMFKPSMFINGIVAKPQKETDNV